MLEHPSNSQFVQHVCIGWWCAVYGLTLRIKYGNTQPRNFRPFPQSHLGRNEAGVDCVEGGTSKIVVPSKPTVFAMRPLDSRC